MLLATMHRMKGRGEQKARFLNARRTDKSQPGWHGKHQSLWQLCNYSPKCGLGPLDVEINKFMCKAIKALGNTAGKAWSLCVTIHLPERYTSGTEFIKLEHWLPHINLPEAFFGWPSNNFFYSPKQWKTLVQGLNLKWAETPSEQHARCFAPIFSPRREQFSAP